MRINAIAGGIILFIFGLFLFYWGNDLIATGQVNQLNFFSEGARETGEMQISMGGFVKFMGIIIIFIGGITAFYGAVTNPPSSLIQDKGIINKNCDNCKKSIPVDSLICPYCRYDFEEKDIKVEMENEKKSGFCPNCGTKLDGEPKFCFICGKNIR